LTGYGSAMISPSSAHLGQSLMLCLWVAVIGCSDRPTAIVEIPPGAARNVILISLDTVRADHLSAYGYERATSPSLDGVATQGALFRNAVAVSPWTRPSHTTLLTGVYPLLHGARSWDTTLSDSVPTLAEIFERDGWRTGGVVGAQLLDESSGLSRGFETYEYIREWHGPDDGARKARNAGNLVTDEALSWLSDRDNRRFFLFLHYYDVHSNYAAQTKYQRMFDREPQRSEIDGSTSQLLEVLDGKRKLSEPDLGKLVALY
jgi:arylsulfatase A-like enzyme